ncbi:diguanylate cyclase [Paenibacillus sp. PK3_47]|uniref:ATP-binding protein n=1 Tax=Paenibacillus sp. PK3_47 TaxID=2072642 RepID=UPI00201E4CDE|nr:ATP-binding protein [Paenibacillus sp. PK3_47]UQZ37065.1 diguanylate cyclase [Paenibacillus sp. PK3_47]
MQLNLEHYNVLLVLFSVAIAFLSCFTAVDLTDRMIRRPKGYLYLILTSSVLGIGMWSMHFTGMMAMRVGFPVSYDLPLLIFSLAVPVLASYMLFGMYNNPRTCNRAYLGFGGILFSGGMLIMHYSGVMAMRFSAVYEQSLSSVVWSILFSLIIPFVTASYSPAWLQKPYNMFSVKKIILVLILTASLTGTHYTAMSGASFVNAENGDYTGIIPMLSDSLLGVILGGDFVLIAALVVVLLYRDRQRVIFSARFNEQRYMALFEYSPDMVACIDPVSQKVISANPSLRETIGYSMEELLDYSSLLCTTEDESALRGAVERASAGESTKLELTLRTKEGRRLICSTTVFPLANEKHTAVYIVSEDITSLAEYQQQLILAKEEAESAVRMKSEFLATMSYEIRTPLNGIIGINQLLAEEIGDEEQLELLQLQSSSSQALLNVINDILDISRLEADAMQLYKEPFELPGLLAECMSLFEVIASDKELKFTLQVSPAIPEVLIGDCARIRQILVNLIGNAVKFTPAGEIRVTVEGDGAEDDIQTVQFRVTDTGIGIAPDKLQLLFQPFSQLDASHNRKYPGTGLGLAICKKLVELMEGEIWVESPPGGGAAFIFRISLQSLGLPSEQGTGCEEGTVTGMNSKAV